MGHRSCLRWMSKAVLVLLGGLVLAAGAPAGAVQGGATVTLDGHPVLVVSTAPAGVSVAERASLIERRLAVVARDLDVPVADIRSRVEGDTTVIVAGTTTLAVVTDADAAAAGRTRDGLAAAWLGDLRAAVARSRDLHSWWHVVLEASEALGGALLLVAFLVIERRLYRRTGEAIARRAAAGQPGLRIRDGELLSGPQLGSVLFLVRGVVRWVIIALLLDLYLVFNLRFIPGAETVKRVLDHVLMSPLEDIWNGVVGYLPNLLFVAVIVCLAVAAIRFSNFLFDRIDRSAIVIPSFHRDLAKPTAKLVQFGLAIVALIAAFPYLPGAKSPAFEGISIFLGVLLSLGSSSAVANTIAGVILIYMRPFQAGDRVAIAGTVGDVVERTILVTRIRTVKNEVITIPNAAVMAAHMINFSSPTRDAGLILHTAVTIGYDAPWRTVHDLLLAAARGTPGVLAEPAPFVLQTALNDFYVTYELNAYTADANRMAFTYSALHGNIQDRFNEGGIEINSPHYGALRDGNRAAVPDAYLPAGYRAPGFRVDPVEAAPRDGAPAVER